MNQALQNITTSAPEVTYSPKQEKAINAIVEWYGIAHRTMHVTNEARQVFDKMFGSYTWEDVRVPHFDNSQFQQIFYLAGYAGTGKTTVVAEALRRIRERYGISSIPTGAYTGKAAHVLRQKGNYNAQTIHSMIYVVVEDEETKEISFSLNPLGSAGLADLICLDECSMIDTVMANDLLSFRKPILVMGDPGQLPPVSGDGQFTNRQPDFFLDEIHRQAADSPIIEIATMARQGIMPPIGYSKGDVRVLQLTNATADEYLHNPDTQVLCGLNRIRWAVTQLMRKERGFGGVLPLPGERILCCKNNKEKGLFNGAAGTLRELKIKENGEWNITGEIEGRFLKDLKTDPFLFQQHFTEGATQRDKKKRSPNEFDWGYIWSVHKAQGSGWPHVTLIDNSTSFRDDRWKHLYTGITRAESGLIVLVP